MSDKNLIIYEIWNDVDCYGIKKDTYEVSTLGRFRRKSTGKVRMPKLHKHTNNLRVSVFMEKNKQRKTLLLGKIVLKTFAKNQNEGHLYFFNGDKADVRFINLAWTKLRVDYHMKLSKSDIEEIKQRRENGLPRRKIANEYGISEQLVRSIECSQKYNLDKVKSPKINKDIRGLF